jgi:hypothetical protein
MGLDNANFIEAVSKHQLVCDPINGPPTNLIDYKLDISFQE